MYRNGYEYKRRKGWLWWVGAIIGLLFLLSVIVGYGGLRWYSANLEPLSSDTTVVSFSVPQGATSQSVAVSLEQADIIRSARVYSLYIRFNDSKSQVLAGEYELSRSMSVPEIATLLSEGENSFTAVTILPAQRLDQIKEVLVDVGYSSADVDAALVASQYADHPALKDKPAVANLEGYLHPETFNVGPSTTVKEIITLALDETAKLFTSRLRVDLQTNHNLSLHEAVILASIVEREVNNPEDRAKVAQVFLTRFKRNITLGSDPTALYGALIAGIEPSVAADTLYNTRLYPGLPPGPINNISAESLQAVAYPAETDFLFFVSGDDGNTYFSHTQAEHEALAAEHCIELCRSY